MTTITSSVDLWRNLCSGAGLELRLKSGRPGRDADVERALRMALAVPDSARSLERWLISDAALHHPTVSTERLLVEVLRSQSGFAKMMQDILDVLIIAEATQASHQLSVEFKFDHVTNPIKATLEQFRKEVNRTQHVLEKRPKLPNPDLMWQIHQALRNFSAETLVNRPAGFPSTPTFARTGHPKLDIQLTHLTRLVSDFRTLWMQYGTTRSQVFDAIHDLDINELAGQLNAATDYWDVSVLSGIQTISDQVNSGRLDPREAITTLSEVLARINWTESWVELTVKELLDVLNLPTWQRRYELYSVWVGTRMLKVVEQIVPEMYFHPVDGVLSFEFGGSRLATFNWEGRQLDIWAELRSALIGRSSKRKKGIQPDFRVLQADVSKPPNAQTIYVLECKHYLKASTSNFTQAATDYARSCPNAVVHIINHGPADGSVLSAALPSKLKTHAKFIGNITPLQEAVAPVLSRAIQDTLFPSHSPPVSNVVRPRTTASRPAAIAHGCVGYAMLEWNDDLDDMDLALNVIGPEGRTTQSIDFRNMGALDDAPFARLVDDVRQGPGKERIDISTWHFSRYELIATNFSKSGRMMPQTLHCSIATERGVTQLHCPVGLAASCHEWRIAELRVNDGVVTIVPHDQ